jgi:hypothetical protein
MPNIKESDIEELHYHLTEIDDNEEEDDTIYNQTLEFQDWQVWYSNDLMNMWMGIRMYCEDSYLRKPLMGDMQYIDFCEFVYAFSTGRSSRHAN